MAIAFNTLFTALGKIVGGLNEWNTGLGATLDARVSTLRTQVTGIDPDLDDDLTVNKEAAVSAGSGWVGTLSTLAANTISEAVFNDRDLADRSFNGAFTELVRQMTASGESLATSVATIGSVTASGVPTGTPTFIVSDLEAVRQQRSDWTLPDSYVIQYTPSGWSVQGLTAAVPSSAPNWPQGSGVSTFLTGTNAGTTSLGSDPGFELWTGTPVAPTQWTIFAGTAGTTVNRAADTPVTGVGQYALELVGNATTLSVRQAVNLTASTVYYLHAFVKRTANPANTGTLTVALRDGSGTLVSGTTAASVTTAAASTSWTPITVALTTPSILPSAVYLDIRYDGGAGDTVRVDQVAVNALPALYANGLRLAIVNGVTAPVAGDTWTLSVTRASPTASFIRGLDRLLSLGSYSVRIPTSGAPTQADALVS